MVNFKELVKKYSKIIAIIVIFILTISVAVSGFQLDSVEDSFLLKSGSETVGYFIIDDYTQDIRLETTFDWISFDENKNLKIYNVVSGKKVSDKAISIPYYIKIPDNADVGIYRTTINVYAFNETQYLNIKINIQNGFFSKFIDYFRNISQTAKIIGYTTISAIVLIVILLLRKSIVGTGNGKRR